MPAAWLPLWQSFPLSLQPVIGTFFGFPLTWYALFYILAALCTALFFFWLARKEGLLPDSGLAIELVVTILWGVVIGARLGYVLFYGGSLYMMEPWRIISPYDFNVGQWIGIRGMSFHGGLIGGAIGLWMFTREAGRSFLQFADTLVRAVPIALFFGRIGNFLNLEIIGRVTTSTWGMHFPGFPGGLRHPVTLYEALAEGLFLFLVLNIAARYIRLPGLLSALFLCLYALIRYVAEDFRELSTGALLVFNFFTIGQALSFAMLVAALAVLLLSRRRVV